MANQFRQSESGNLAATARDAWARDNAEEIFREMVLGEIQGGRVSRGHHARMLAFAGQIGINHAAAAALISDCCVQAAAGGDPQARQHAARLIPPAKRNTLRACLIVGIIVAAELALILLF